LAGTVKQELLVTRVAHRLGLRQETVWARFGELKAARKKEGSRTPPERPGSAAPESPAARAKPARQVEKELMQILLAEPGFVRQAYTVVWPADIEHPGLQQLLGALYRLHEEGGVPEIDGLREVIDNPALID